MVDADAVLDQRLDDLQVALGRRPLQRRVPSLKWRGYLQPSTIVLKVE